MRSLLVLGRGAIVHRYEWIDGLTVQSGVWLSGSALAMPVLLLQTENSCFNSNRLRRAHFSTEQRKCFRFCGYRPGITRSDCNNSSILPKPHLPQRLCATEIFLSSLVAFP